MIIFIDESGTHKQVGHSTTAVVYIEVTNQEKFEKDLRDIERALRIQFFHWSDERWFIREKFIRSVLSLNFKAKIAVFRNPINPERMIEAVFKQLITETNLRKILIDGKKPKWYEQKLKKVLRDKGVNVAKLKTARSTGDVGIQLADALAGLVRYCYDKPEEELAQSLLRKLQKNDKILGIFLLGSAIESFTK